MCLPLAALLLLTATPAAAAVGGDVTLLSEAMFRGRSISAGRPAARIGLSYDDLAGPYAGLSVTGVLAEEGEAQLLSVQEYAGFAHPLQPELTLDIGVVNTRYSRYWSGDRRAGYTEIYAGLIGRRINGRISLSPNYLRHGRKAAYGELNAILVSSDIWDVSAHGGVLLWIGGSRPDGARSAHYDWEIGGGPRIGQFRIRAAWVSGGPNADYYHGGMHHRGRPTISLSASF